MLALIGTWTCQQIHLWLTAKLETHVCYVREMMPFWNQSPLWEICLPIEISIRYILNDMYTICITAISHKINCSFIKSTWLNLYISTALHTPVWLPATIKKPYWTYLYILLIYSSSLMDVQRRLPAHRQSQFPGKCNLSPLKPTVQLKNS